MRRDSPNSRSGSVGSGDRERARLAAVARYQILDTPPDGAFDRIAALAANHFDVPIALVTVVDEDRIWFKSRHGIDVEEIGRDPGLCASCILQEDAWIVENATTDPRTLSNPLVAGELGLQFYAGAPLRTSDGHNLGTLCVIDHEPREFGANETARLEDMAEIVMDGLELRLAALQAISEEQQRRLESDAVAEALRRSLLPTRLPTIPGADVAAMLMPASRSLVGGDFYDCFTLSQDRWALVIGDVAGKGPEAAAVTAMVRHAARSASVEGHGPAEVLQSVNRVLLSARKENDDRFATLIFVELTQGSGGFVARIARAGHPPELLATGAELRTGLVEPGPLLGAFPAVDFDCASIELGPNDVLLLHTDGLSDARTGSGFLGSAGIADTVNCHRQSSASEIVDAMGEVVERVDVRDDVAVLVWKCWALQD